MRIERALKNYTIYKRTYKNIQRFLLPHFFLLFLSLHYFFVSKIYYINVISNIKKLQKKSFCSLKTAKNKFRLFSIFLFFIFPSIDSFILSHFCNFPLT